MLEAANVRLAYKTLGSVMSPILPPPAELTVSRRFSKPQVPFVLSVAVKVET